MSLIQHQLDRQNSLANITCSVPLTGAGVNRCLILGRRKTISFVLFKFMIILLSSVHFLMWTNSWAKVATGTGSVHDLGTGRVNRVGSDVLELLWRKFTKKRADAIVRMNSGVVRRKIIPHNFGTLHAKLRYSRSNSLRDKLCHLMWTWKTETHTHVVGLSLSEQRLSE